MSDLIERAAKAAFEAMRARMVSVGWLGTGAWESESEELREDWRESTRAAIEEITSDPRTGDKQVGRIEIKAGGERLGFVRHIRERSLAG